MTQPVSQRRSNLPPSYRPSGRPSIKPSPLKGLKCPSCGSQVWREGQQGENLLCGSINSCGWGVESNVRDFLLAFLVPRITLACPKGHTGALVLTSKFTEDQLEAICWNTDLRFKPGRNSQTPDFVDGSGSPCFSRCTIPFQELRPRERDRVLQELRRWKQLEEKEAAESLASAVSSGETYNSLPKVTSQPTAGSSAGSTTGNPAGHTPRQPSGFLDPHCPKSKHNETKWLVLGALVRLEAEGQQVVYTPDGTEYAEWQLQGGLASSVVAATGLSRSAVSGCLRRCQQARYLRSVGEFALLRGSRAAVYRVTGKGHAWLRWAQGTSLGSGVAGND